MRYILQKCSLSTTLFKIYNQGILNISRKIVWMGIQLGDRCLTTLLFADDQVIIACDKEHTAYIMRNFEGE